MEGAPKPKGRRRLTKKHNDAGDAAVAAATAGPTARPAATAATEATEHTQADDAAHQPKPSLSQQLGRSLKRLSQLAAGSRGEEGEVEQRPMMRGEQAAEPAPPAGGGAANSGMKPQAGALEEDEDGNREGAEDEEGAGGGRGLAGSLAALRRTAAALPAGLRLPMAAGRFVPAAVALLLLAALGGGLLSARRQARAHEAELGAVRAQLAGQRQVAAADSARMLGQLAELEGMVRLLNSRTAASSVAVQQLRQSCGAQAEDAAGLHAELAAVREATARLQLAAANTSTSPTAQPELATAAAAACSERMREVAQQEVSAALALFAADRTGLPDFALASIGGAVVAHSPAHMPPQAACGAAQSLAASFCGRPQGGGSGGGVHPQANRLLLAPVAQPGACLPLVGSSGWVDIRLAQPLRPSAFTYEHIPAAIAHDIRSAPRNLTLLAFRGRPPAPPPSAPAAHTATASDPLASSDAPGGGGASGSCSGCSPGTGGACTGSGGIQLGEFAYEAHAAHAVQTFPLTTVPPGLFADHIRLLVGSNHGHPGYTCLYRIRVHGTPAAAVAA